MVTGDDGAIKNKYIKHEYLETQYSLVYISVRLSKINNKIMPHIFQGQCNNNTPD